MTTISTKTVETVAFTDQRPGTSGLRKKVKVFKTPNYTENFVQAILESIPENDKKLENGNVLVLGGDGRYYMKECIDIIIKLSAANNVNKIIVGTNGILSTPAGSNLIRKRKATGGILLTASHNPGGPTADFGIKYNMSNGGPAPEKITEAIFSASKSIKSYKTINEPLDFDLSIPGIHQYTIDGKSSFTVEVIDSVDDYVILMKEIFDFGMIRSFIKSHPDAKFKFDALHGVTGPYMERLFVKELGLPSSCLNNCDNLPDFGGLHPDPNLTYAKDLVIAVNKEKAIFGAASDGDGDRNMIIGNEVFVNPCDSVAVIAEYAAKAIPYFKNKGGLSGVARSMPTSSALDRVAANMGIKCYEVPTGWKFFGNLMDAGLCSLCGEESFGTGSDHVREKDGLWAVLAWLSILAYEGVKENKLVTLDDILLKHFKQFGRSYFARFDYEEVDAKAAINVVDKFTMFVDNKDNIGKTFNVGNENFQVVKLVDFTYTDPVDNSISTKQGLGVTMKCGTRIVLRASGTGSASSTSTLRVYLERVVPADGKVDDNKDKVMNVAAQLAEQLINMATLTGRSVPTVIT